MCCVVDVAGNYDKWAVGQVFSLSDPSKIELVNKQNAKVKRNPYLGVLKSTPHLAAQASTHSSHAFTTNSSRPNRVVTRSATMLALFGIALSSFSLKQLLAKKHNKHNALRKL